MSSTHRQPATRPWQSIGHVAVHLITPLLMCLGMGLAYLSAFHQPEPNHLKVAVIGTDATTRVLAQTVKDRAGDALDVTTVADRDTAVDQLRDRAIVGAFVPDTAHPELIVAKASSETSAGAAQAVFSVVAAEDGTPLTVTDLTSLASGDPTGQGLFFLLVVLSLGSYASVAAIGAAGAAMSIWARALIGLVTSLIVSGIAIALAGPVFHVVDHAYAAVWAMGWLYSAGILAIGIGLHTFLQRWTTLAMMTLFVMLNFTSSGGIFRPDLQNGFFGTLHAFWTGAGFLEGVRTVLYFDSGAGFARHLATLGAWFAAGLVVLALAALRERRAAIARRPAPAPSAEAAELEESLAVAA